MVYFLVVSFGMNFAIWKMSSGHCLLQEGKSCEFHTVSSNVSSFEKSCLPALSYYLENADCALVRFTHARGGVGASDTLLQNVSNRPAETPV